MTIFANIGAAGLYLLFVWLLSAAIGSWLSERKGYGEKLGLTFGLLLSAAGLLIVLLLPARWGSYSLRTILGIRPQSVTPLAGEPLGGEPSSGEPFTGDPFAPEPPPRDPKSPPTLD